MAKQAGTIGFVGYGDSTSVVLGINTWSLDYTVAMLDTTDFSASGVRSVIPGVSQWEGSFGGYKDGAPLTLGTANSVSVFLGETAGIYWSGVAYINGIHVTDNYDGIVSYTYDFTGTGALTPASA